MDIRTAICVVVYPENYTRPNVKGEAVEALIHYLTNLQPKVGPISIEVDKAAEANKHYNHGWNDALVYVRNQMGSVTSLRRA